jgi:hypothetical protein
VALRVRRLTEQPPGETSRDISVITSASNGSPAFRPGHLLLRELDGCPGVLLPVLQNVPASPVPNASPLTRQPDEVY